MNAVIPIILFAYARPKHLKRTLACLRENQVPLIYAFSDGPKTSEAFERVSEVRTILREIDWCEVHITERTENLGLGTSILSGVGEMFKKHEMLLVFEDDLICIPGTYQYLSAALGQYKDTPNVMSVTGFNHPLNTPKHITDQPYFDGRADCWVWGSWARAWEGMHEPAEQLVRRCLEKGIDPYKYGASLPPMAKLELQKNIWAVRLLYLHILRGGLCLRPPYSMVEHIGVDTDATNARTDPWPAPPLKKSPPIPNKWPAPVEHPDCSRLWQEAEGLRPTNIKNSNPMFKFLAKLKHK
jgi:hypothetical protein